MLPGMHPLLRDLVETRNRWYELRLLLRDAGKQRRGERRLGGLPRR